MRQAILAGALALAPLCTHAEVKSATPESMLIEHRFTIAAPATRVWETLLHPERWWPADHTWSGKRENLATLRECLRVGMGEQLEPIGDDGQEGEIDERVEMVRGEHAVVHLLHVKRRNQQQQAKHEQRRHKPPTRVREPRNRDGRCIVGWTKTGTPAFLISSATRYPSAARPMLPGQGTGP